MFFQNFSLLKPNDLTWEEGGMFRPKRTGECFGYQDWVSFRNTQEIILSGSYFTAMVI